MALAAAIEDLHIGGDVLEVIALRDRLDARIATSIGELDAAQVWAFDASTSMVAWLRAHARMTKRAAQRLLTVGVPLRRLPLCAEAYADGRLSGGQIEAIVGHLDDELLEIFAAHEAELVPYLIPLTVAGVSRAMAAWLTRARPEPTEPSEPERALYVSQTLDDRRVMDETPW